MLHTQIPKSMDLDAGGRGKATIDILIKDRREVAEKRALNAIREKVSEPGVTIINASVLELKAGTMCFDEFASTVKPVLRNLKELRTDFLDIMMPGTDKYIFTAPNKPPRLRPYVKVEHLALEWEPSGGARWSTTCGICLSNLSPPIRTLECMHSYCERCIAKMMARDDVEVQTLAELWGDFDYLDQIECPTCKNVSDISASPHRRAEKVYNDLLESHLKATLKYTCPFDCDDVFTREELDAHMSVCLSRKYICDKGCNEILRGWAVHDEPRDCVDELKEKVRELEEKLEDAHFPPLPTREHTSSAERVAAKRPRMHRAV